MGTTDDRGATGQPTSRAGTAGAGQPAPHEDRVPRKTAWTLGLLGLIPFVLFAALFLYAGRNLVAYATLELAFAGYSATILAFLGGIRWGLGLVPGRHRRRILIFSVVPSLFGWAMLLVPAPWTFAGFALAFALQGVWDRLAARGRTFPDWFSPLRLVLTVIVVLCQIVAFVATM